MKGYTDVTEFTVALFGRKEQVALVTRCWLFGAPENVRLSYAAEYMVTLKEAINRIQTFMEK